ncbi:MAG: VOC family protein [Planctomycetaceae bacterium]
MTGLVLDHLIVSGDVVRVGGRIAAALGVDPDDGGVHPGAGTRNQIFALQGGCALEVLGPDPAQEDPRTASDAPEAGSLWWWAVRADEPLDVVAARVRVGGFGTTTPESGERVRPNGERLTWETIDLVGHPFGRTVPFVIRWLEGVPPSLGATSPASVLRTFVLGHPDPQALRRALLRAGILADVERAERPTLRAEVAGAGGTIGFVSR